MGSVAVIDYGMGNLHSVAKALEKAGDGKVSVDVTSDPHRIRQADRVVLPGVGAIRDCIVEMRNRGVDEAVREAALEKPFLAVCVGMQALMEFSAENGGTPCLGVLRGKVAFFGDDLTDSSTGERLKVPHMGWNQVFQERSHPLWQGIPDGTRFYFVHSYYVPLESVDPASVAGTTRHGVAFASALASDNLFAVQFHPEKSQQAGLTLYGNFLRW